MPDIQINGNVRPVDEGTTLSSMIADLGFDPRKVAVEHNLQIVPRSLHATTVLTDGDRIELVQFVGGG